MSSSFRHRKEQMIEVECDKCDCLYFHKDPKVRGRVWCSNQEKKYHLNQIPCPLYKMNWQKQDDPLFEDY